MKRPLESLLAGCSGRESGPSTAVERSRRNLVTTLFSDDFSDHDLAGWDVLSATWDIGTNGDGIYMNGDKSSGFAIASAGDAGWHDVIVKACSYTDDGIPDDNVPF